MPSSTGTDRLLATRSRLGVVARRGDSNEVAEARRAHAEAKLAAYIDRVADELAENPLTLEQRDRLAALLRPRERVVA